MILVSPEKLDALKKWTGVIDDKTLKAVQAQAAKKIPFIWMTRRPKAGALFFVAADDAAMKTLIDHFMTLTAFREGAAP